MTVSQNKELYLRLKNHLSNKGIKVNFWVRKNLPEIEYGTAMAQFHGNYKMSNKVREAILNYLNNIGSSK